MYHSEQEHSETVTAFALEFITVLTEAVYTVKFKLLVPRK